MLLAKVAPPECELGEKYGVQYFPLGGGEGREGAGAAQSAHQVLGRALPESNFTTCQIGLVWLLKLKLHLMVYTTVNILNFLFAWQDIIV